MGMTTAKEEKAEMGRKTKKQSVKSSKGTKGGKGGIVRTSLEKMGKYSDSGSCKMSGKMK